MVKFTKIIEILPNFKIYKSLFALFGSFSYPPKILQFFKKQKIN